MRLRATSTSVALMRELIGLHNEEVASLLVEISILHLWRDDLAAAERTAREALDILTSNLPKLHPDPPRAGYYRTSLAAIQIERKEYGPAEKELRAALVAFESLPPDHPYVASAGIGWVR